MTCLCRNLLLFSDLPSVIVGTAALLKGCYLDSTSMNSARYFDDFNRMIVAALSLVLT